MALDPSTLTEPEPKEPPSDPLAGIDDTALSTYILRQLKNDITDREQYGWTAMREYDQLAYDGYKQKATEPWFNASNFAVPLTSTLLDTGHSHTIQSIWSNPKEIVRVEGVAAEDDRNAPNLQLYYNWKIINDIDDAYFVVDNTVKTAYKHGNAYIKVTHGYQGPQKSKVIWSIVPPENIFMPVQVRGLQPSQSDHVFELIPLTENDIETRKALKKPDGTPFYDGIGDIPKGNSVQMSAAITAMQLARDITGGTSLGNKYSRDMRYILEAYLTYYPPTTDGSVSEPLELIVWMAPNGGKILNKVINPDLDPQTDEYIRPYASKWVPYPREDRHHGDSLPWMVKQIQEELDYAHNQNLNAAEIAIKPPKFYRQGSGFDPELYETTPDGWYPVSNPQQDIFIPTFAVNPVMERQEDKYWDLAERRTGFTELFQGRAPDVRQTATLTLNRENKSEVRFGTIYKRFGAAFNELMQLTYFYDRKYTPPDVKIQVLGYADYKSLSELFPDGIAGHYNFFFRSETIVEQEQKKKDINEFYTMAIGNPLFAASPANQWNLLNMLAESKGIRNLDRVIQKPVEVNILSAEEAIRRIISGQYDLQPNPEIDAADYMMKIQMFMRTDTFIRSDSRVKQSFMSLMANVQAIQYGQNLALHDAMVIKDASQANAQAVGQNTMQEQAPPRGQLQ